jgi:sugar lactone lactonase YvrE
MRIQKYDASGRPTLTFSVAPTSDAKTSDGSLIRSPWGMAFVPADGQTASVHRLNGSSVSKVTVPPGTPSFAIAGSAESVYYYDTESHAVVAVDANGKKTTLCSYDVAHAEETLIGVTADPNGGVYVFDMIHRQVYRCSTNTAQLQPVLSLQGDSGQLCAPEDVTVTSDGNVWVADTGNRRIQGFRPDGTFLSQVPIEGRPLGIASDLEGNLYVSTEDPVSLVRISPSGVVISEFSSRVANAGVLQSGGKLLIADRMIYVCDHLAGAVQIFNLKGHFRRSIQDVIPLSVASDGTGGIYVGDVQQILRFSKSGKLMKRIFPGGTGKAGERYQETFVPGSLAVTKNGILVLNTYAGSLDLIGTGGKAVSVSPMGPRSGVTNGLGGMAVSNDGTIYVADTLDHRVVVLRKS